jgi:hypothetical protein
MIWSVEADRAALPSLAFGKFPGSQVAPALNHVKMPLFYAIQANSVFRLKQWPRVYRRKRPQRQ